MPPDEYMKMHDLKTIDDVYIYKCGEAKVKLSVIINILSKWEVENDT